MAPSQPTTKGQKHVACIWCQKCKLGCKYAPGANKAALVLTTVPHLSKTMNAPSLRIRNIPGHQVPHQSITRPSGDAS
ncbi:hypothetical protein PAXRUDRAFT_19318 [Paxillus rubicundulus Ve08.2h10]|uniref:Unplaced genomic scaffold scaffold_3560, whole genome shotgun sequence n=1 Tax=Paxillus rubicundulus Ve08.2h10 TaxID=930991 RepID=A0A0D0D4X1_9AGAM|nr:hypothetical protein PAXRUDRAFT_19318 [Paxillus rubicundulus Ve08.2h10]